MSSLKTYLKWPLNVDLVRTLMSTKNFHEVRKRILAANNASQTYIDSLQMRTHTVVLKQPDKEESLEQPAPDTKTLLRV